MSIDAPTYPGKAFWNRVDFKANFPCDSVRLPSGENDHRCQIHPWGRFLEEESPCYKPLAGSGTVAGERVIIETSFPPVNASLGKTALVIQIYSGFGPSAAKGGAAVSTVCFYCNVFRRRIAPAIYPLSRLENVASELRATVLEKGAENYFRGRGIRPEASMMRASFSSPLLLCITGFQLVLFLH